VENLPNGTFIVILGDTDDDENPGQPDVESKVWYGLIYNKKPKLTKNVTSTF
jgi:hypothetical protein